MFEEGWLFGLGFMEGMLDSTKDGTLERDACGMLDGLVTVFVEGVELGGLNGCRCQYIPNGLDEISHICVQ